MIRTSFPTDNRGNLVAYYIRGENGDKDNGLFLILYQKQKEGQGLKRTFIGWERVANKNGFPEAIQ